MWIYKNRQLNSIEDFPENSYGFVYKVTHIPSNICYIGKKVLFFNRTKKRTKKEIALLKEEKKRKGQRVYVSPTKKEKKESDWKTYYGSQKEIKDLVSKRDLSEFKREILEVVPNKKLLTYFEMKYLFKEGVIEPKSTYLNDNIAGKFFRKDFE